MKLPDNQRQQSANTIEIIKLDEPPPHQFLRHKQALVGFVAEISIVILIVVYDITMAVIYWMVEYASVGCAALPKVRCTVIIEQCTACLHPT